jgi:hypothetical protein
MRARMENRNSLDLPSGKKRLTRGTNLSGG